MAAPTFCFIMPFHITEDRGGGAEVQAWFLARELARRGFRTSYIAQSVRGKQGTRELVDGVTIRWIRYAHHFRWFNALDYYRALTRADADFVIQRMTAFTTGVAALWCRRRRRKFIWICSDDAVPRKWHFVRTQRAANRAARPGLPKRAIFLVNALITDLARQWGMRHVSVAFTQNDTQKALLGEAFGLDSKRMISGHPGPARIMSVEDRLARPVVLWAAHLGINKQPEKFVALARAAEGTRLSFVMAGGHSDDRRIDMLFANSPRTLTWLGKLPFDRALKLFDEAAFFVNTSNQDGDGFPNTFIQAWMRGVPVFSLGVDPDRIITRNGLGFVSRDPMELLAQILALASDPTRYQEMSASIKRFAESKCSIVSMCDHFLASLSQPALPANRGVSLAQTLERP